MSLNFFELFNVQRFQHYKRIISFTTFLTVFAVLLSFLVLPIPPVFASSISSATEAFAQSASSNYKTTITKSGATIKKASSISSQTMAVLKSGCTVTVIEQSSDWCKVKFGKRTGYIQTKYLDISNSILSNAYADSYLPSQGELYAWAKYWKGYAADYARSIGLNVLNEKGGAWDNPIRVNEAPGDADIASRIHSRLNRYKNDYGVTIVSFDLTHEYNNRWQLIVYYD